MGNGDEASGDGWIFRGKGLIQLTGKQNHENFAKFLEKSLNDTVQYLLTPEGATISAGWFFAANGLMNFASVGDMKTLTKRINGGLNGYDDRINIFNRTKGIIRDLLEVIL